MENLRVLCRVVTYDSVSARILLVRNKNQNWWCLPGGGWDHNEETILECAKRETFEETGIYVIIVKLLYVQTLDLIKDNKTWLEHFWIAEPTNGTEIPNNHIDKHGTVEEARWFSKDAIKEISVYPTIFGSSFWNNINQVLNEPDRYIGHFEI